MTSLVEKYACAKIFPMEGFSWCSVLSVYICTWGACPFGLLYMLQYTEMETNMRGCGGSAQNNMLWHMKPSILYYYHCKVNSITVMMGLSWFSSDFFSCAIVFQKVMWSMAYSHQILYIPLANTILSRNQMINHDTFLHFWLMIVISYNW